jgi:hypothetical protein
MNATLTGIICLPTTRPTNKKQGKENERKTPSKSDLPTMVAEMVSTGFIQSTKNESI